MKEVKTFIIVWLVVAILKIVGGVLCNSLAMIASAVLDIVLILLSLLVKKEKENKRYKGFISSLVGLFMIVLGIGLMFLLTLIEIKKTSFFILLFIFITILVKYIVGCFYTNINSNRRKGLLTYGNINSTSDFIIFGIVLVTFIVGKFSKWFSLLKFADMLGLILISLFIIYKGIKVIARSISYLENKEVIISSEFKEDIINRTEVKKLVDIKFNSFGGIRQAKCDIMLNDGIAIIDINTFVVTLQDYLLKIADVAMINLVSNEQVKKNKPKVRSLKQDARNSRSGNGKTNAKKKNSSKKNKKR